MCLILFYFKLILNFVCGYSAQNWRFAAKQMLKKYPQDLLVHCEFFFLYIFSIKTEFPPNGL